jgi:hypothetical protein
MPEFQGPDTFGDDLSVSEVEILEESLEPEFLDEMEEELQKGEDLDLYANLEMSVLDVDLAQGGWKVEVAVENLGLGASGNGTLDIFVIHMASEELLGETSRPISTLKGGERIKMSLLVPSDDEPGKEILVGASLKMPSELSADNNSAWFIPWKDRISSSEKKKKFGKSTSQVTLLHQPRLWRDDTGNGAWIVISAVVAGGRSSRRITGLQVSLVNEAGPIQLPLNDDEYEPIWMSVPDLKRRVVPAETLAWFRLNDDLCDALTKGGPPTTLDVTITGADIEEFTGNYPLDPEFATALVSSCPAAGSARPASPAD